MANDSSRRALLAAALVPAAAVRGTAANSAVKVGLIGSGGRGTHDATHLARNTGARVVALCDIFDERIENARKRIGVPDAKAFKNYHELLASDVEAVIIATPVWLHPEHFEAAVKAGKHIYMEKPAGLDVAGCKRVIKAADSADRKFDIAFGFQQRYGPGYRKAHHLAQSGALGAIRMGHAHFIKGTFTGEETVKPHWNTHEERVRDWHVWKDSFGDIVVETYVHSVDVLNWFLGGRAASAYGIGGRIAEKRGDISDHCDITFTYPNGTRGVLTGAQLTPRHFRSVHEQFYGSLGVVETAREYWKHFRSQTDVVTEKETRDITIDGLQEFIKRIEDGRPENVGVRGAESTLTAIMGRMAMEQKREITWEEMMRS